ncbi:MAG: TetR/AcrR family transcriptional regulator [Candidatus Aphodousia sp.]|nr:TetR/AcrR family transcriptional regulator [Sutterella sp.]MDY2899065.1 TetR/AcrR family transcriptional regulator [Candidatus Aphodousia sp.]
MRKVNARVRGDGEKTREALIQAAGVLAAERGWSMVTAKDVCDYAGVNGASINYWFGSRDALYEAVLKRIPEVIFSQELEIEMVQYETAEGAIRHFLDYHLSNLNAEKKWPIRIWAREVTGTPAEQLIKLFDKIGHQRMIAMRQFFADYLEIEDVNDLRVQAAQLTTMSSVMLLMILSPKIRNHVYDGFTKDSEQFSELIKEQIMTGLSKAREDYRRLVG